MMARAAMGFGEATIGEATISYMDGNEPGYAVNGVLLRSVTLPAAAVALIAAGKAVRITEGGVEEIEGEPAGLIVFGRYKGDRPALLRL